MNEYPCAAVVFAATYEPADGPTGRVPEAVAGAAMIRAERLRQVTVEGYDEKHDAHHGDGDLIRAAVAYATAAVGATGEHTAQWWPFDLASFKPGEPLDSLVKAGALIAAGIDRIVAEGAGAAEPPVAATGPAEAGPDAIIDLKAERDEAQSEAAMIRDHANRFLRAVYGPDVVYRAPETFSNPLERWIWAVGAGVPEIAHACIADIERQMAITGTGEEPS